MTLIHITFQPEPEPPKPLKTAPVVLCAEGKQYLHSVATAHLLRNLNV